MFKLIFEKELREMIQSSRFTISFGVYSALILVAFYMGVQNYQTAKAQYEAAISEQYEEISSETNWSSVQPSILLPPQPLSALVTGISNDIGRTVEVSGSDELHAENTRFNDEPIYAVFRFLDLEFIFSIVLSLFAIVFAYDAINGERERGTLKLSFANSVPRAKYLLAKFTGSFTGISISLLLSVLLGCLLLPVMGINLSIDEWLRLGLIVFSGLLYFGVFLALSIAVSSMTRRSSTSFLIMLVIWIFSVFIIPRASVLVSGRLVDVPNVDELIAQKSNFSRQLFEEDRPKMASFKPDDTEDPQDLFKQFSKYMSKLGDERKKKLKAYSEKLFEEYENKRRLQYKLALGISRVSPTAVYKIAVTRIAGTSVELEQRFLERAENYQKIFTTFMEEKTGRKQSGFRMVVRSSDNEKPKNLDPNEMPVFEYKSVTAASVIPPALTDIGILLLFIVLFFGSAFLAFLKYDLR